MNPIGLRIKQLRKLHQLTQNDVAVFVGVQRVSVSKWESQSDVHNTPKGEHLFKLCTILRSNAEYLLYGKTQYESSLNNHKTANIAAEHTGPYLKRIPLLDWKQLHEPEKLKNNQLQSKEVIFSHQISNQGYALPVIGDSMTSAYGQYSFPEGVYIIFDPTWSDEPYDEMFVIAQVDGEIKFRQVKFDGTKAYLNPLNSQYPKIFKTFKVIGKVTEMQMKLP